jgi:hypothetical protein
VLLASIAVYLCGIVGVFVHFPSDYEYDLKYLFYVPALRSIGLSDGFLKRIELIRQCLDLETILEALLYLIGISYLLVGQRGLAIFRVFRIFRFFAYFRRISVDEVEEDDDVPPENVYINPLKTARLCAFYMQQLYYEFATEKSLGGLLVITIFFFTTYVMAVVFTNEKGTLVTPEGQICFQLRDCFLTVMRLALYDGNGFDFMQVLLPLLLTCAIDQRCRHRHLWTRATEA